MGWFLLLFAARRELGRMVDGQLAKQTAMNDVEALLERLTSRYRYEAVRQLCTPSRHSKIAPAGVPSPQEKHALSSFFLSCACCLQWAGKCMPPQSRGMLPVPRRQLELDLYISGRIFAKAKPSGVHDMTQLPTFSHARRHDHGRCSVVRRRV